MLCIIKKNSRRVNQFSYGDKYDMSVEALVAKSSSDMVIIERDGGGFIVSDANYTVAPTALTATKEAFPPSVKGSLKTTNPEKEVEDVRPKRKDKQVSRRSRR